MIHGFTNITCTQELQTYMYLTHIVLWKIPPSLTHSQRTNIYAVCIDINKCRAVLSAQARIVSKDTALISHKVELCLCLSSIDLTFAQVIFFSLVLNVIL